MALAVLVISAHAREALVLPATRRTFKRVRLFQDVLEAVSRSFYKLDIHATVMGYFLHLLHEARVVCEWDLDECDRNSTGPTRFFPPIIVT